MNWEYLTGGLGTGLMIGTGISVLLFGVQLIPNIITTLIGVALVIVSIAKLWSNLEDDSDESEI